MLASGRVSSAGFSSGTAGEGIVFQRRCLYCYTEPRMELDVQPTQKQGATVLALRGEIDVYTAPRLRQAITDVIDSGAANVILDMEQVDFLDSTGLGVLVGALKRAKSKDGVLSIVATQDKILKIFDITGLNKVFPMHGSVDEAIGSA